MRKFNEFIKENYGSTPVPIPPMSTSSISMPEKINIKNASVKELIDFGTKVKGKIEKYTSMYEKIDNELKTRRSLQKY